MDSKEIIQAKIDAVLHILDNLADRSGEDYGMILAYLNELQEQSK